MGEMPSRWSPLLARFELVWLAPVELWAVIHELRSWFLLSKLLDQRIESSLLAKAAEMIFDERQIVSRTIRSISITNVTFHSSVVERTMRFASRSPVHWDSNVGGPGGEKTISRACGGGDV
jgi:hypothetical protein